MLYKKNKTSLSRKKKNDTLDHSIENALNLMQENEQIVCLVQSPTTRAKELADIFHSEFPNYIATVTPTLLHAELP
jgi:hypothetical protein